MRHEVGGRSQEACSFVVSGGMPHEREVLLWITVLRNCNCASITPISLCGD